MTEVEDELKVGVELQAVPVVPSARVICDGVVTVAPAIPVGGTLDLTPKSKITTA